MECESHEQQGIKNLTNFKYQSRSQEMQIESCEKINGNRLKPEMDSAVDDNSTWFADGRQRTEPGTST